ncbi:MAG: CoA-binding protein [Chloroflexi bacterium]|nr:CoA-binding protein [Chloroflexota bacterium]
MATVREFAGAFEASSVAFVGASLADAQRLAEGRQDGFGATGFISFYQGLGYRGRLYAVNPRAVGESILGLNVYPSLSSLPEVPDLVIVSVPRELVPDLLRECARIGAKNIHLFTAGFEETGEEEGVRLGREVRRIIAEEDLRVIGPNGMGLCYVPRAKMATFPGTRGEPGDIAFVSQSGGHANDLIHGGEDLGLRFSKVVSFGNAYGFDAADLLEYMADDPETSIIGMYMEGAGNGRKLLAVARRTVRRKPVLLWKGGLTQAGSRATRSHTSSLAGEEHIWQAFFRQSGAIRIQGMEEMLDCLLALRTLPPITGHRIALLMAGGGNSVAAADSLSREGLDAPHLAPATQALLRERVPIAGTSVRNPLDAGALLQNIQTLDWGLKAVMADPSIDAVFISLLGFNMGSPRDRSQRSPEELTEYLSASVREGSLSKPLVPILTYHGSAKSVEPRRIEMRDRLLAMGLPVFYSLPRAARAVSHLVTYYRRRAEETGEGAAE